MSTYYTLPQRPNEAEPVVVELEDVPTADDLVRMGLAEPQPKGIRISDEGHALMGEIMRRNGRALAAAEAARPTAPTRPLLTARQQAYLWAREAFGD